MNYTDEQMEIITTSKIMKPNEILKINAFAGTGKTTTLKAIAEHNSDMKFLYLAFNKAIADKSSKEFPKNVECRTTHSLAYAYVKPKNPRNEYRTKEIADYLNINFELANKVNNEVSQFLNGEDTLEEFKKTLPTQETIFFLTAMLNGDLGYTHSLYLKMFQLSKSHIKKYDYILLDEGQDTNPVTMSIFLNKFSNSKLIIVGDTHQQIYAFRGSINAMSKVKSNYTHYLTNTFRCSQNVVNLANLILKTIKEEKNQIISHVDSNRILKDNICFISRNNSTLISSIDKFDNFYLTRNYEDIFKPSINIYGFLKEDYKYITQDFKFLKNFSNINELEEYIKDTDDMELKSALKIAQEYGDRLLDLKNKAYEMSRIHKDDSNVDIILTTAHSSKGLEYKKVFLMDDFKKIIDLNGSLKDGVLTYLEYIQEINLLYVAITRAKDSVYSDVDILEGIEALENKKHQEEKVFDKEVLLNEIDNFIEDISLESLTKLKVDLSLLDIKDVNFSKQNLDYLKNKLKNFNSIINKIQNEITLID